MCFLCGPQRKRPSKTLFCAQSRHKRRRSFTVKNLKLALSAWRFPVSSCASVACLSEHPISQPLLPDLLPSNEPSSVYEGSICTHSVLESRSRQDRKSTRLNSSH